jgi:hypothetical protein
VVNKAAERLHAWLTKNDTTIEGGALATGDAEIAASVEQRAPHRLSVGTWQRFSEVEPRAARSRSQLAVVTALKHGLVSTVEPAVAATRDA